MQKTINTFTHSENVAYYATKLAIGCGYDSELVEIINEAALLHDIGKIGISENILKKTSKLSDEEYQIMQSHVEASVNIIRHLPSLDYVIPIVLTHHERYDGVDIQEEFLVKISRPEEELWQ